MANSHVCNDERSIVGCVMNHNSEIMIVRDHSHITSAVGEGGTPKADKRKGGSVCDKGDRVVKNRPILRSSYI